MTMHMGDLFSRSGDRYDGAWPQTKPQTTTKNLPAICSCGLHPVRGGNLYCDMCLAAQDSTNQDLLDHGLVQPGDL
jgi:hypothetical protein